jgi:hypothetical protein
MPMTPTEKSQLIGGAIALIPYLLIVWAYTAFISPETSFWKALGVLVAVRVCFGVVEFAGSVLAWRVYGRRKAIDGFLRVFDEYKFPRAREYRHDEFGTYIHRIVDGAVETSSAVQQAARELDRAYNSWDDLGIFAGWRMHSASDAALDRYAPRSTAAK